MQKGYITLISILVVGAVGIAITTSLILLGLGASRSSFALEQSYQTKALTSACAEEALQQIADSNPYTGSGSLSLGQGDCNYTVTNTGGTSRNVEADGTVDSMVRKVEVNISKVNPVVEISSWQEVADF